MKKETVKPKKPAKKAAPRKRAASHNNFGVNGYQALTEGYESLIKSNLGRTIKKNVERNDVALGLLIAGALGVTAMMILKAKKPKSRTDEIIQAYHDLKNSAGEYVHDAYESATDYAENMRENAIDALEDPVGHPYLVAGTVGGTLLGAAALYLLSKKVSAHDSEEILDKVKDMIGSFTHATSKTSKDAKGWLCTIKNIAEAVQGKKASGSSNFHHALELGINGLSLIDNLMKKR